MEYKYGMRLRGFSPMCQPKKGFIRREDDATGDYYDIIVYNRQLTDMELNYYELDELVENYVMSYLEDINIDIYDVQNVRDAIKKKLDRLIEWEPYAITNIDELKKAIWVLEEIEFDLKTK